MAADNKKIHAIIHTASATAGGIGAGIAQLPRICPINYVLMLLNYNIWRLIWEEIRFSFKKG